MEGHIASCEACSEELEELGRVGDILKDRREDILCPSPEELFEIADKGGEPTGKLAEHLRRCPGCAEELEQYSRSLAVREAMPERVRAEVRACRQKVPSESPKPGLLGQILEHLSVLVRRPAIAVGVAAAVILAVVLFYPRVDETEVIALSDASWQRPTVFMGPEPHASVPQVAIILVFKGLRRPLAQDSIDTLYDAAKPPGELWRKYSFLSPADVKKALQGTEAAPIGESPALGKLRDNFPLSRVVIVTIASKGDRFLVTSELKNARTGESLRSADARACTEPELPAAVRSSFLSLLNQ